VKLYDNWRQILKKSWSLKFVILAIILNAVVVVFPSYWDSFSRDTFSIIMMVLLIAAGTARVIAQHDI
jgi:hypothetical protein